MSPITIEVSAFIKTGDSIATINDRPEQAHGFAVYICAPTALHVTDFDLPGWLDASEDARALTLKAAFTYADHLAGHLGGGAHVESALDRPSITPAMDRADDRREERDAAACLWEAALALRHELSDKIDVPHALTPWQGAFLADWEDEGTAAMRYMIGDLAPACHADYLDAVEQQSYDSAFDWEYVPTWLTYALRGHYQRKGIIGRDLTPATGDGRPMLIGDIMDSRTIGYMLLGKIGAAFKTVSADKIGGAA